MKYDSGYTPTPQEMTSPYTAQQRQEMADELRARLAEQKGQLDERSENYQNVILPLCESTSEASDVARRNAYMQRAESQNVFWQYQQQQRKLEELRYLQQQRIDAAQSEFSGLDMRSQRDRAGAEAGAEFDERILQAQGVMTQSLESYNTQEVQAGLANQESVNARFENIHAYNNAISEGFSLASDYMDLLPLQRQIGFFDTLA